MPTPMQCFRQQRANARRRDIDFYLTFDEWWAIWKESGLYHLRGRRGFVMHRNGDEGAYEVGNVEIVSATENFRHAMEKHYDGDRDYI